MTRAEKVERLKRIADRLGVIDRELLDLCPFRDKAGKLNTERIQLVSEAAKLNQEGPQA